VRAHADRLCAVVVEPLVQAAAGMIAAPEGWLMRVRDVTRECGVLLIADEVAVGCGRTGTLFACEQEGVAPDFLCLAKGLTGGYLPLAATLTTDEVYNAFLGPPEAGRTFYHGHTYTGNPLGAAAALASLDLLAAPAGLAVLPARVQRLAEHLERCRRLPAVGDVRQRGLMAGIELVRDKETKERFPPERRVGAEVCRRMREQGVLLRPLGDVVVAMPPLAIDLPLLDRLGEVLYNGLQSIRIG
jgi:adenosylmethionine-8-amino-7-oxononanoate aminotransferase